MTKDADVHTEFDRFANGAVQAGELPPWTRVRGRVIWYVYQGPYSGVGEAWRTFMQKAHAAHLDRLVGPPGDVYVCAPEDHQRDGGAKLTTVFWAPIE